MSDFFPSVLFACLNYFLFANMREDKLRERTWCRTVGIWLICLEITLISGSDAVNNTGPSIPIIFPILVLLILPALFLVSFRFKILFPARYVCMYVCKYVCMYVFVAWGLLCPVNHSGRKPISNTPSLPPFFPGSEISIALKRRWYKIKITFISISKWKHPALLYVFIKSKHQQIPEFASLIK